MNHTPSPAREPLRARREARPPFPGAQQPLPPEKRRTVAQNRLLWACLNDVSARIVWHGQYLTPPEWKDLFTAALRQEKVVPGINGGVVVFGERTRGMSSAEMAELIESVFAFAADRGITLWSWEQQP